MKINNIIRNVAVAASVVALASCESDYLSLQPEIQPSTESIAASTATAQRAIYGICSAMQTQYSSTSSSGWLESGEAYFNTLFNEGLGQDAIIGMAVGRNFSSNGFLQMTDDVWTNENYILCALPWAYGYNIINQANVIIDGIDNAEGSQEERDWVKAQALTFRAFGYIKLLQWFAPRWQDSNNGEKYCLVYRDHASNDDAPLATMNKVLDLIYSDLTTAISCYQSSGMTRGDKKWAPDLSVAYGLYARAALIKEDWATAQTMAHNARQGYQVMDNDTYFSGYINDNNDTMWTQSVDPSDIYYWSWGSFYSANGAYVQSWNYGAGAIDMSLYNQLDPNDVRRLAFLTPDKLNLLPATSNPGKITEADFWDHTLVEGVNLCDMTVGPNANPRNGAKWGLVNFVYRYCKYYLDNVYKGPQEGVMSETEDGNFYLYYSIQSKSATDNFQIAKGQYAKVSLCPLGAQFKFISTAPYGVAYYPFMRAAEMCLVEAEAAYHNSDMGTAKACLQEINGKRIPGSTVTAEGEDLLNQIKLCRRIELWGEGYNFPDFKRWNEPFNRVAWSETTPGGNWQPSAAGVVPTSNANGWRMVIPYSETAFNKLVDKTLVPGPSGSN